MTKLARSSALGVMSPVQIGTCVLSELAPPDVVAVMPYSGAETTASDLLQRLTGLALPEPGRSSKARDIRCLWAGREQAFVAGQVPDLGGLSGYAAVVDVSDAWAILRLSGPATDEVLSRLTPLDLHPGVFRVGHTARTELKHRAVLLTRLPSAIEIWVMRSMAHGAVDDISRAMRTVAARARHGV